jgi:general secretion pathway protein B
MSYILEALADSEQARQQIAATPKYSLLPVVGEELSQQRRWPYVLAGALLLNAAVLQIWLRPAPPDTVASIEARTVPQVPVQVAKTPVAAAEPDIAPLGRGEIPAADLAGIAPPQARSPESRPERANDRRVARLPASIDALPSTATATSANGSALMPLQQTPKLAPKVLAKPGAEAAVAMGANPAPPSPAAAGDAVELPPVLQQQMPALSVAGFIRGEGSASMVIVNDRLVREGDEVAPGVKLEKILNDSLVFNYKGYRFKR